VINDLPAPRYPAARIDQAKAAQGAQVYRSTCAVCHSFTGAKVGQAPRSPRWAPTATGWTPSPELANAMNTLGSGRPWHFHNFRKTDGYANEPLDGAWLRAPYLHSGSVPDIVSLLMAPDQRPKVFFRSYDVDDWDRLGFVTQGPEAERAGFRIDTSVRGNGSGGHTYGTGLPARDKEALIEYLKTL
jgi:hypothetical protein